MNSLAATVPALTASYTLQLPSFRSSLKDHWLGNSVSIQGIHQLIFSLLSLCIWNLLNKFSKTNLWWGLAPPKQCIHKPVADMLLFFSVDMSLEFLGANPFLSFPSPFPPLQRHPQIFFLQYPRIYQRYWQQLRT